MRKRCIQSINYRFLLEVTVTTVSQDKAYSTLKIYLSGVREGDRSRRYVRVVVRDASERELAARLQSGRRPQLVLHAVELLLQPLVRALALLHVNPLHSDLLAHV